MSELNKYNELLMNLISANDEGEDNYNIVGIYLYNDQQQGQILTTEEIENSFSVFPSKDFPLIRLNEDFLKDKYHSGGIGGYTLYSLSLQNLNNNNYTNAGENVYLNYGFRRLNEALAPHDLILGLVWHEVY